MELAQLKYFMEVASTQHVTKSAEKLHIAQPALTQSIHRLEEDIGVKLFEAKGRNIVLTEYGKYLQQSLEPILSRLDRIPEELRRMAKLDGETIRINVLAASAIVTEAILEYKKKSSVNFTVFQSSDAPSDLEVTTKISHAPSREREEFVLSEKILLAVPKERFFSERVSVKDIEGEGFICLLGPVQFRAICDKFCRHAGFQPKIMFESDNPTAVRNAIAANMGVGFWPEFTWGSVGSDKIKLVEIFDLPCYREIILTLRSENENAKKFFAFLKEYFLKKKLGSV